MQNTDQLADLLEQLLNEQQQTNDLLEEIRDDIKDVQKSLDVLDPSNGVGRILGELESIDSSLNNIDINTSS